MAISGRLVADFDSFFTAVTTAQGHLRQFQESAGGVGGALNKMVDGFDGKKLADEMRGMGEATVPVAAGVDSIFGKLGPLAAAVGIGFSISSVVSFGKEILADADAMQKLADKTGIAIEPLQRLQFAAEQSGNTFPQVTSAITAFQNKLAEGDKSAVGAVNALGLSLESLVAMSPDEQFIAIAREVAKIEDPMQRAKVAMDLFGRSGAELLPTLIANIEELGNEAPIMSEKTVKAFDAIGDAASKGWTLTKVTVSEAIGTLVDGVSRLNDAATAFMTGDFVGIAEAMADLSSELPKLPPALDLVKTGFEQVTLSAKEMDRIEKELTKSVEEQIKKSEQQKAFQDRLFGFDLMERASQYVEALGGVNSVTTLTTDKKKELHRVLGDALEVYKALGAEAPDALVDIHAATTPLLESTTRLTNNFVPLKSAVSDSSVEIREAMQAMEDYRFNAAFAADTIELELIPAVQAMDAEVAESTQRLLSWSEAMEKVAAGQGTLTASAPMLDLADFDARYWELFETLIRLGYTPGEAERKLAADRAKIIAAQPRAMGGPVSEGSSYVVGERGPELFIPRSAGTIFPSSSVGSTNVITINTMMGDSREIARAVEQAIIDAERRQGRRLPPRT